jgi:phosphatidylserine/phosphatidylglycerophosphate/cardiolipin synthase-like enzyme
VWKKLGAASVAAMLLLILTPAAAAAFTPANGPRFNNPWGDFPAKERLLTKLRNTIDATPKSATIRIAAYSNDRKDITDALIRAHRRGVDVRVLLNDNWTSYQTRRLRRVVGGDRSARSFLHVCDRACRGGRGNLHSKFYLFSRAGKARHVVMFGSVNLTGYGAKTQWNDLYTTKNRRAMHNFLAEVFGEMARDRKMAHPFRTARFGAMTFNVYPRYGTHEDDDPVMERLRRVRCKGTGGETGIRNRTMLRINMYGWNGDRGVYLAKKVAQLSRRGCNIKVIASNAGGRIVHILAVNGVQIKSPDYDRNENGKRDMFTHDKYILLSGRMNQKSGWWVWTGSQNWSNRAVYGDDITVGIKRRGVFWKYRQNFNFIWDKHSWWMADTGPASTDGTATTRGEPII